jgi:hypothetical protein
VKSSKYINRAALIFIFFLFISNSYAGDPESAPFSPNIPNKWTKITPGPTHFMGRDLAPSCSGFPGTNPIFSFFVKGGNVNNLVIYFEGGGSCWNDLSCLSPKKIYKTDVTDADSPVHLKGMFDLSHPYNPFKDWNFVYIPYCTGDVHCGDKDAIYKYGSGQAWTIHHRGHDNFLAALKWVTENFKQPDKIFVTGSSAGSYGAIGGAPWVVKAYSKSKWYVLGDAGIGVIPKEFSAHRNEIWNFQFPKWIFGENPPFNISDSDFWKAIANYYPHIKWGEFTNAWDMTQIYFYNLFLHAGNLPPAGGNVCAEWNARMLASVEDRMKAPNYRIYIAPGTRHTILATRHFYTETTAGVSFLDWLNAMIDDQGGPPRGRHIPWENVKCIECDAPTDCRN